MIQFSRFKPTKRLLLIVLSLAVVIAVSGCHTLGFYAQAFKGQYQIFSHQEPVAKLIDDPKTPVKLRQQLELLQRLREFADTELKLPVDGHYRKYVDVHRPYVVWNIQAAPRFSLAPRKWWYPLVGSLEYRGYFSEKGARDYAGSLRKKGDDVYVGGVDAYSTLGWFKDPVLNTFIFRDESELAETIFHELGHQRVFARGDTDFNEAFATVVGEEGARRWLRVQGDTNAYEAYIISLKRNDQFVHLIMKTRLRLEKVYGDLRDKEGKLQPAKEPPAPREELQREKQKIFEELRSDYATLKAGWNGYVGYDGWFGRELNNAQLNTIANYYDYVPGFEKLLALKGGNFERFYGAAERLAKMPQEERHQWLRELARGGQDPDSNPPSSN
jgi:predicted aminopeptidase